MRICKNCGVELDDNMEVCPLCDENDETKPGRKTVIYPSDALSMAKKDSRKYAWELSGVLTLSGIIISIMVDLVFEKGLSWSLYSVTSLLYVWTSITIIFFARKKPFILLSGLLLVTLGMLVLIDMFDKPIKWFGPIALPIAVTFFALVAMVILSIKNARYKGFNILAVIMLALCLLCLTSELFIDLAVYGRIAIKWSAIVTAALLPVSMVLLFLHYRLKRGRRLDGFFHV
jgi:RNA polymerase subunit RPABC4/transcription elongation factor Spt4